jgi:hypothetical protein
MAIQTPRVIILPEVQTSQNLVCLLIDLQLRDVLLSNQISTNLDSIVRQQA